MFYSMTVLPLVWPDVTRHTWIRTSYRRNSLVQECHKGLTIFKDFVTYRRSLYSLGKVLSCHLTALTQSWSLAEQHRSEGRSGSSLMYIPWLKAKRKEVNNKQLT